MNWKSFSFNQISIFIHAPAKSGVYVLHNSTRCVFVGETANIRDQLLNHLRGDNPLITVWNPSGFCFELWPKALRLRKKNQMALEFRPAIGNFDDRVPGYSDVNMATVAPFPFPRP